MEGLASDKPMAPGEHARARTDLCPNGLGCTPQFVSSCVNPETFWAERWYSAFRAETLGTP